MPALTKIEKQQFRRICGKFASGITVATVLDAAGASHGMTANSFTSVSLTPPLVLAAPQMMSSFVVPLFVVSFPGTAPNAPTTYWPAEGMI